LISRCNRRRSEAKVGRLLDRALRESAVSRDRTAFSLRGFHDGVLGYGALPVSLIRWGLGLDE
jgi:uncharacterized protein (DUF885 family)